MLREQLGMPLYDFEGWDNLCDRLIQFRDYPITIEVYGLDSLSSDLFDEVFGVLAVFAEVNNNSPYVQIILKS